MAACNPNGLLDLPASALFDSEEIDRIGVTGVEATCLLRDMGAKLLKRPSDSPPFDILAALTSRRKHIEPLPLSQARLEIVKQLQAMGADINTRTTGKSTPLHSACEHNGWFAAGFKHRAKLAQHLLAAGADVDAQDCRGRTALSFAASDGNLELVAVLLDNGASFDLEGRPTGHNRPKTALDLAAFTGWVDTVQLLLNAGAKSSRPGESVFDGTIEDAASKEFVEVAELIQRFSEGGEGAAGDTRARAA
ncbi:ankyrin repeat-containing domain protein [Microdochium bolleyi]|uniref:Ankyrin repeat-containing domain protein n=1 Tax=Microdochium bolleyi TaxID=196109 RepID=A0A136IL26_9PEZI|nr:ankyrin repeat-containing domain protein [Microdochium bolleyi]